MIIDSIYEHVLILIKRGTKGECMVPASYDVQEITASLSPEYSTSQIRFTSNGPQMIINRIYAQVRLEIKRGTKGECKASASCGDREISLPWGSQVT